MARRGGFIDGISFSRRKRLRNRSAILRRGAASASAEGWHRTTELREGGIKRRARGGTAHFKREREQTGKWGGVHGAREKRSMGGGKNVHRNLYNEEFHYTALDIHDTGCLCVCVVHACTFMYIHIHTHIHIGISNSVLHRPR